MSIIGKQYMGRVNLAGEAQEVDNSPTTVLTRDAVTGDVKLSPITNVAITSFIKSNEDLSLAKRKDNFLYGILDQYTGEETTLFKIDSLPSGATVDNIIFFQLGSEYFKRNYVEFVDIRWWGAVGDDSTDNHDSILDAINYAIINKGARILIPDDGIYLTSPIVIPTVSLEDVIILPIEICGKTPPSQLFGTVGTAEPLGLAGSILKCTSTTPGASVISTIPDPEDPLGFSAINLIIKDLEIRLYQDPFINGVDATYAIHFRAENLQVNTSVYSVDAIEPTHGTAGVLTPKLDNGAITQLHNVSISGFHEGLVVNEHTDADGLNITCNKYAMVFKRATHASRFGRVCVQRNTYGIRWDNIHTAHISQLNFEHVGPGQTTPENAWQTTIDDIEDPNNYGRGEIWFTSVLGAVGTDPDSFSRNGGDNLKIHNSYWPYTETPSGTDLGGFRLNANPDNANERPWMLTTNREGDGSLSFYRGIDNQPATIANWVKPITFYSDRALFPNVLIRNGSPLTTGLAPFQLGSSTGLNIGMFFDSGRASVSAYDDEGDAAIPLAFQGLQIEFRRGGVLKAMLSEFDNFLIGTDIDTGEKLNVNGDGKLSGKLKVGVTSDTGEKLQVTGTTRINVGALDLGLRVGNGAIPPFSVYGDGTVNCFNFNATKGQVATAPVDPTDVVRLQDLGIKTTASTSSTVVVNPNTATSYRLNAGVTSVTLPPLTNNEGKILFLINASGNSLMINSNSGGNDILSGDDAVSTYMVDEGQHTRILHDGTTWTVL